MNHLEKIIKACRYLLNHCPEAQGVQDYLDGRLGKDAQEKFKFGYFPDPGNIRLLTSLVGEDVLRELGLFYTLDFEDAVSAGTVNRTFFPDHPLIMPYRDVYGNTTAIVARTILDEEQRKSDGIIKYKNTVFKKGQHLFGLYESKQGILKKDFVYVVEGQFDVIKASEKGIDNIVALGNSSITDYQVALLSRYTRNILLLLDNDVAGEAGRALAENKFGNVVNINNIYLPQGYKDIDDYLKDNNGDSLMFATRNSKIVY